MAGLIAIFILNFGYVSGNQFNPATFSERSFTYVRLPPTNIPVYPVTYSPKIGVLTDFLSKNLTLLGSQQTQKPIWHVTDVFSGISVQSGDAKILTDCLLELEPDGSFFWSDWSHSNPKLAAVLWPLVSKLAMIEAYLIVPDLLQTVKSIDNQGTFEKELKQRTAELCASLGQDYLNSKNAEKAIAIYKLSIELNQDSDPLFEENRKKWTQAVEDANSSRTSHATNTSD